MSIIQKMNKWNKHRVWFWVAGMIGAVIFSRFVSRSNIGQISIPLYMQIVLAIISVGCMGVLVWLGYILGKKIDNS